MTKAWPNVLHALGQVDFMGLLAAVSSMYSWFEHPEASMLYTRSYIERPPETPIEDATPGRQVARQGVGDQPWVIANSILKASPHAQ